MDNIALLVSRANIPIIRIGDKKSIDPDLHEFTLDGRQDDYHNKSDSKKARKRLKSAKVIFATCVGCGTSLLKNFQFAFVIVDEASLVSEPTVLIPLSKKSYHFLLVGDHKQLRPFSHKRAKESEHSISLLERLYDLGYPSLLLDTKYRMHPGISLFPNTEFYGEKMKDGISEEDRVLVLGFDWPNAKIPVAFVQVSGEECLWESSNIIELKWIKYIVRYERLFKLVMSVVEILKS